MRINLETHDDRAVILFRLSFDPVKLLHIKQLPNIQWYPPLGAWGTRYSPLAAWLCLRHFPDPQLYEAATYERLQPKHYEDTYDLPTHLYPFQESGTRFLLSQRNAILGDCPGAGKTVQGISFARHFPPTVVVCPASVKYQWREEIYTVDPDAEVQIVTRRTQHLHDVAWTILNPDLLLAHYSRWKKDPPTSLLLDEAHEYRNLESQRTRAMLAVATRTRNVIPITGTPLVNRVGDLFPLLVATKKCRVDDHWYFLERYCDGREEVFKKDRKYFFTTKADGLTHSEELRAFLAPFVLRRSRETIGHELPPLTRRTLLVDLTNADEYATMQNGIIAWINQFAQAAPRETRMIKINKLRHCAARGKVAATIEQLQALREAGEKAVVICSFLEPLNEIEAAIPQSIRIDGGVSPKQRQVRIKEFQTSDDPLVALCSMKAGGVAVTLTSAQHEFILDIPWSPVESEQAEARIYRHTQALPTTVTYIVAANTVDKAMLAVAVRKARFPERVFEGGDTGYVDVLTAIEQELLKGAQCMTTP